MAEMPERYQIGKPFTVRITVMPDTNTIVYAVEDQPPVGWEVKPDTITGDGVWDSLNRKVKWGPEIVSDGASRSNLTYQIIPPVSATGTVEFAGVAIFDNSVTPIGGQRQMLLADRDLPAFVERRLPNGYTPGLKFTVTLFVTPPTNTAVYVVQDQPPVGWLVMTQNVAGLIDAASGTIEFGPFFDANPRTLTYEVTPLEGSDVVQFSGLVNADVLWSVIRGAHTLGKIPFHPADNVPAGDNYLTIAELTSYASAWKLERPWPNGPSPIPISFLANAIALWLHGEAYQFDPQTNSAPPSWTNRAVPPPWPPVPPGSPSAYRGTAVADLPAGYQLWTNITVSITVTPQTNVTAYAVEDQPPDAWLVSQMTGDGLWDDLTRKVKWGPFFDRVARTLAYQATPASNTLGVAVFAGVASFDGANLPVSGQRQTGLSGGIGGVARRQLPGSFIPGMKFVVKVQITPPPDVSVYVVEDQPPAGWLVRDDEFLRNQGGRYDAGSGTVRFDTFFDSTPQTLIYEVTPPPGESGVGYFNGLISVDGVESVIAGDNNLPLNPEPLHPADGNPVDKHLSIAEVTAYDAAWKTNSIWPAGPNPIPPGFVTRAIALWRGGEFY